MRAAQVEPEQPDTFMRGYLAQSRWQEPSSDDPLFACQRDDECVLVYMDGCDEVNGGWVLSMHRDRVIEAEQRWGVVDPPGCTAVAALYESFARCAAGTCVRSHRARRGRERYDRALELLLRKQGVWDGRELPPDAHNRIPPG